LSGGTPQPTGDVAPANPATSAPASKLTTAPAPVPATQAIQETQAQEPDTGAQSTPVALPPASPDLVAGARCANCNAPQTGPYCAQCGQKQEDPVQSVWHFLAEAAEGLTHADSRLWQTLIALLVRPGALTREFLDGHRVRYLPPLRLYLLISLAYFLLQAYSVPSHRTVSVDIAPGGVSHGIRVGEPHTGGTPMTPELASQICQNGRDQLHAASPYFDRLGLEQTLFESCRKSYMDGGSSLQDSILHNLEREMFAFFPMLALFAGLLYRHPRHHYVEHLLFFVHNQSFFFLVLTARALVALATPASLQSVNGVLDLALFAYIAWYLFRALRRVYGQGRLLTLTKYMALAFFYVLTSFAGIVLTVGYSFLTL